MASVGFRSVGIEEFQNTERPGMGEELEDQSTVVTVVALERVVLVRQPHALFK